MPRSQGELVNVILDLLYAIPQMVERFWLAEVVLAVTLVLVIQLGRTRR